MKKVIKNIKDLVKKYSNGNAILLDKKGIELLSCDEIYDSLSVIDIIITPSLGTHLHAHTNRGYIDLESAINNKEDWYTIEKALKKVLKIKS